jgi:hypothetical protein
VAVAVGSGGGDAGNGGGDGGRGTGLLAFTVAEEQAPHVRGHTGGTNE